MFRNSILVLTMLALSVTAPAAIITHAFSFDSPSLSGSTVTGSFSYDDAVAVAGGNPLTVFSFNWANGFNFGEFSTDNQNSYITNVAVTSLPLFTLAGLNGDVLISFVVGGDLPTTVSGSFVPQANTMQVAVQYVGSDSVSGHVTYDFATVDTPEPGGLAIAGMILLSAGFLRRRRRDS